MRVYLRALVAALIVGADVFLLVVLFNVTGWLDTSSASSAGPTFTPWPTATVANPVLPTPTPRTTTVYVIKSGEVLADIAKRYDLSVQEIAAANNITDVNTIKAGQPITIPIPPSR